MSKQLKCYTKIMSQILLLTGPPGAGKTTASKEFAQTAGGTWALVEQDAIRQLVKAGFKNPSDPWTKATETQMNVSIAICGDMARRYHQAKVNCIIDCFITLDPYVFDKWQAALEDIPYKLVVFLPESEKAVAQNNQRTGDARLKEELVIEQHKEFLAWRDDPRATIIDTTAMDVTDAVQEIRNIAKK
jgi:predicted ATPase